MHSSFLSDLVVFFNFLNDFSRFLLKQAGLRPPVGGGITVERLLFLFYINGIDLLLVFDILFLLFRFISEWKQATVFKVPQTRVNRLRVLCAPHYAHL
jgi:hypothetical protein